jgi:hypothetical protein
MQLVLEHSALRIAATTWQQLVALLPFHCLYAVYVTMLQRVRGKPASKPAAVTHMWQQICTPPLSKATVM